MNAISAAQPPGYAELCVASNFSFLRGASHADELAARAVTLGLAAIGVADRNSLAGIVRAHAAVKELAGQGARLRLVVGARLVTTDGLEVLVWPTDRAAYGRLCVLLTAGGGRGFRQYPPHPSLPLAGERELRLKCTSPLPLMGRDFLLLPLPLMGRG
jgi:DNA polymerase III alpha subunit